MSIRSGIVLGFASCGVYSGGAGLEHIRVLESLKAADAAAVLGESSDGGARLTLAPAPIIEGPGSSHPARVERVGAAVLTSGVAAALVISADRTSGRMWWWWWLSLQHMGVVLTHRLQHLALADPFLIGSVLAVLVVAAFAVLVAVVATTTDDSPASPRILVGRRAEAAIGGSPCAPGRRPHRAGVRRLRVLTRRPPTVETSYPDNRPIARTPVLRRAKR